MTASDQIPSYIHWPVGVHVYPNILDRLEQYGSLSEKQPIMSSLSSLTKACLHSYSDDFTIIILEIPHPSPGHTSFRKRLVMMWSRLVSMIGHKYKQVIF
uniref:Uncharacterized protein n=1 Tax=viral metagenome TaxID=1070528 RepID=A0A6C0BK10_9ZZZZ